MYSSVQGLGVGTTGTFFKNQQNEYNDNKSLKSNASMKSYVVSKSSNSGMSYGGGHSSKGNVKIIG